MLQAWNVTWKSNIKKRLKYIYKSLNGSHQSHISPGYTIFYYITVWKQKDRPRQQRLLRCHTARSARSVPADSSFPCRSPWRPCRYDQAEPPSLLHHHPQETPPQTGMEYTCLWRLKHQKEYGHINSFIPCSVRGELKAAKPLKSNWNHI